MLHGNYRVWNYHRFRRPGRVDAHAIMKYLLGERDAVNLQRRRRRWRWWWCSCSSILFNLPRYREMHSIAISPGVEDSAHLRTLSFPRPPPPSTFALSFQRVAEEGVGALEGSCIQLITPPGLITSRPGSRPTVQPTHPRLAARLLYLGIPCESFRRKLAWRIRDNNCNGSPGEGLIVQKLFLCFLIIFSPLSQSLCIAIILFQTCKIEYTKHTWNWVY